MRKNAATRVSVSHAVKLANDFYVGKDSHDVECLFTFGDGIELRTQREAELAREIVACMKVLARRVASNTKG